MLDLEELTHIHYDSDAYKSILRGFKEKLPNIYNSLQSLIRGLENATQSKDTVLFNHLEFLYAHAMGYYQFLITEHEKNVFNNIYITQRDAFKKKK